MFPVGEAVEITLKPLGGHAKLTGDYRVVGEADASELALMKKKHSAMFRKYFKTTK